MIRFSTIQQTTFFMKGTTMNKLAIIHGTGLENFPLMQGAKPQTINTPYGEATVYSQEYQNQELFFVPRHGEGHKLPPHLINYRANIWALKQLGIKDVIAFFCVGSLRKELPPGSLTLVNQFIDQTWGREHTFSEAGKVIHTEMSEPYCPCISQTIQQAAEQADIKLHNQSTYICTQGPRLETAAEIRAYQNWGADIVGMTGVPETPLAREAGLCYAGLAVVANYGAGMVGSIDLAEISQIMEQSSATLGRLVEAYLVLPQSDRTCQCK
jgi:5'-methylthioadenosine phosphorylase